MSITSVAQRRCIVPQRPTACLFSPTFSFPGRPTVHEHIGSAPARDRFFVLKDFDSTVFFCEERECGERTLVSLKLVSITARRGEEFIVSIHHLHYHYFKFGKTIVSHFYPVLHYQVFTNHMHVSTQGKHVARGAPKAHKALHNITSSSRGELGCSGESVVGPGAVQVLSQVLHGPCTQAITCDRSSDHVNPHAVSICDPAGLQACPRSSQAVPLFPSAKGPIKLKTLQQP